MNILLDIIGAIVISGMLLVMMFTFQFQLYAASDRLLYTMNMTEHMENTATRLNNIIALAGVSVTPDSTVVFANADSLVFRTKWNFVTNKLDTKTNTLSIKLASAPTPYGTQILLLQNGILYEELGNIFWVNELKFRYYDINDQLTSTKANMRSTELRIAYFHPAPYGEGRNIETKLQFKCYFMNAYMQIGNPV